MNERKRRVQWETIIGIFKVTKAALLIIAAIGLLSILHKDVDEILTFRISQLGVDPDNKLLASLITKLGIASSHDLTLISFGTFIYAGLFLTEGIGLLAHKRWAEYFTAIVTGSFLPIEVYELTLHFTYFKLGVILLNLAIVIYLILRIRHHADD